MKCIAFAIALAVAICASRADSQTLKTLLQFSGSGSTGSGLNPHGSLTISGTAIYGVTVLGGANGRGNIFSIGTDGTNFRNLVSFTSSAGTADGSSPFYTLTQSGTTLYGMTVSGGASGNGNVFSVGTDGTNFHDLLSFTGTGGAASGRSPYGGLTLSGTTLYGVTISGGTNGFGNAFSIGTGGTDYRNLLSFTGTGGANSGSNPTFNLTFGGMTLYGGTGGPNGLGNDGSVFSLGADGTNYQNLLSFTGSGGTASGNGVDGDLTLSGTTLYGATGIGGANGKGYIFSIDTDGTNYRNIVSFTGSGSSGTANGLGPTDGSLILSGTTIYGMTSQGGTAGHGNIFSVGIDGSSYQTLYSFSGGTDGGIPGPCGLSLSGGTLFGMTTSGGNLSLNSHNGYGTVFALALPTPEPSTLALVGCGAVAVVTYRWRDLAFVRGRASGQSLWKGLR
jgi:uncharacterized repeat protein (TIGR03803 family)